jgi:hypothetical protein
LQVKVLSGLKIQKNKNKIKNTQGSLRCKNTNGEPMPLQGLVSLRAIK